MRVRSWMAAAALVACVSILPVLGAWTQGPAVTPQAGNDSAQSRTEAGGPSRLPETKTDKAELQTVQLALKIAGLGREGCQVEVKPGNRGCRFKAQDRKVSSDGETSFEFRDVELRGADRNCAFAITVKEPGQDPRTIYRGFRLAARTAQSKSAAKPQAFTCFMSSPSKLAEIERGERIKR